MPNDFARDGVQPTLNFPISIASTAFGAWHVGACRAAVQIEVAVQAAAHAEK